MADRTLTLQQRYLNFPVKNGAPMQRASLSLGGEVVREFDIELAEGDPDFWVFLDVSAFAGRAATLRAGALAEEVPGLQAVSQDDAIRGAEDLYREKHRPQFHFSSRRGWNNDPNGLVYSQGEYHLYYQHNPYGWKWGNMHWGHAVSTDLVHWRELPIALYPRRHGDWAFSGSAAVDAANTGGFAQGDEPALVAAFTSTGRGECIAYSTDRGRTFTEYAGNPVVRHKGRDPKILWYAPGKHWVMAAYDEEGEGDDRQRRIAFYTSPDLKAWEFQSRVDGYYECPELFELPLDGDLNRRQWVVYAADGAYAIGTFDGKRFTTESGKHRFSWGNSFYASQTFSDIPPEDGRRIQIAWGRSGTPGMPFNQMMSFPVELTLRTTEEGPRLYAWPVREIEKLYAREHSWKALAVKEGENPLSGLRGDLFDIEAEIAVGEAREVGFRIRGVPVAFDAVSEQLHVGPCAAPLQPEGGKIRLRILVDRTSQEVFANGGRVYVPLAVIPPDEERSLEAFARGGVARFESLVVRELRSAWE